MARTRTASRADRIGTFPYCSTPPYRFAAELQPRRAARSAPRLIFPAGRPTCALHSTRGRLATWRGDIPSASIPVLPPSILGGGVSAEVQPDKGRYGLWHCPTFLCVSFSKPAPT